MAIQKGHIKYIGTLGDVRHFKIKGLPEYYAGMKGGPSAEQIANDPAFARTRENMNEFGGSAKAGKSVRTALAGLVKEMGDTLITGRLTNIMKKINLLDGTEARGYRAILISQQQQYLKEFQFDQNLNFDSILTAPFSLSHVNERNEATLTVPAFNPANFVNAVPGATHFRLIHALAVVSDYAYGKDTNTYEPIDNANNELSVIAYSDYLPLDSDVTDQTITATLTGAPVLTSDVSVLECIGIEFFQEVNKNFYLFNSGNCMKIADVF